MSVAPVDFGCSVPLVSKYSLSKRMQDATSSRGTLWSPTLSHTQRNPRLYHTRAYGLVRNDVLSTCPELGIYQTTGVYP